MPDVPPRSALGSTPIPGGKPAGESCRYEPEFEALTSEMDKLESLSGDVPKWRVAAEKASVLLGSKSKDLLVGVYLCRALFDLEGLAGFAEGLAIVRDMMRTFWEDLFPEKTRMRARASALDWLESKMTPVIAGAAFDPEGLQAGLDRLNEVIALAEEKFEGGEGPALRPLARAIEGRLAVDAPASEGGETAGAAAGAGGGPGPASGPAGPRGPIASRAEAFKRLEEVAAYLKKTEPHSPVIYLIERAVRWQGMNLQDVIKEMMPQYRDACNLIWQQFGLERES